MPQDIPESYRAHPSEGRLYWVLDWDDNGDLREADGGFLEYKIKEGQSPTEAYHNTLRQLTTMISLEYIKNKDWRLVISPMGYDIDVDSICGGGVTIPYSPDVD